MSRHHFLSVRVWGLVLALGAVPGADRGRCASAGEDGQAATTAPPAAGPAVPGPAVPAPTAAGPLVSGVKYDSRIPTVRQVLGHDSGEAITTPEQVVAYLKALQAAAPDRTRLVEYARTWEGRPLHVLIVATPERIGRLEEIKKGLQRLADPRNLAPADADALIKSLPVVTWLMHAVHGNEISSSDAALAEAHHLLAAQGDAGVDAILRDSVVIIDPLENPDGRTRFVVQNLLGRAAIPDSEPASAEHDEPWPGGRTNHYLFDMNRDWFSQSQPETRGRTKLFLEWFPQVVVDLHEMGGDSSYYFAPPADPFNPHITKAQAGWFQTFGRANAERFDARGFSYFIREVYDSFYPGYGESWPIFHGAIGMTYEQASARGLIYRRDDDSFLTYRDGVLRHFTAAITTAETAARHRERLLRDFYEYRRSAISEGEQGPVREYVLTLAGDATRTHRLARLLANQGFEVRRAEEAFKVGTKSVPAGAYVIPVAQPASRLLRNLLDPHIAQPEPFVKEQDRRRKKRLDEQIYDVTAWSLPLAFDVEVLRADRPSGVKTSAVPAVDLPWALMDGGATPAGLVAPSTTAAPAAAAGPAPGSSVGSNGGPSGGSNGGSGGASNGAAGAAGTPATSGASSASSGGAPAGSTSGSQSATTAGATLPPAKVAYLLPWGSGTAATVIEALRGGLRVRSADLPFTLGGRAYAGGTAIVRTAENPADLGARLGALAARHGVEVVPIDSAFVEQGISLGSSDVQWLKLPRVLLAWDAPTQGLSAGWARFVLERRFGQPVTTVRVGSIGRVDLRRYDVLVLPSGAYTSLAGEALRRLKDWIGAGGTLVTIAEASRWAARENIGLLGTSTELRGGKPEVDPGERTDAKKPEAAAAQPISLEKAIEPERERPTATPGAFLRVNLDAEHWLSAGTDGQLAALVEGARIFTPLKLDKGRNVGVYAEDRDLVASGLVWDDAKTQLASKAFLMHQPTGQGHVIAFAEDPNFRAFTEATELLFINAVLFGPAH